MRLHKGCVHDDVRYGDEVDIELAGMGKHQAVHIRLNLDKPEEYAVFKAFYKERQADTSAARTLLVKSVSSYVFAPPEKESNIEETVLQTNAMVGLLLDKLENLVVNGAPVQDVSDFISEARSSFEETMNFEISEAEF